MSRRRRNVSNPRQPLDYVIVIAIILLILGIANKNVTLNAISFIVLIFAIIMKLVIRDAKNRERNTFERIEEREKVTPQKVYKTFEEIKKEPKEEVKTEPVKQVVINPNYKLPSISLLNKPKDTTIEDTAVIENTIPKLENTLKSFGIKAKVIEVNVGPIRSKYSLEVQKGINVSKITRLKKEIALALAKKNVEIQVPIPDANVIGVEFENGNPKVVSLYEVMSNDIMKNMKDRKLLVPLGKTPSGKLETIEINGMPHLLMAGTTGSGKTVLLNSIICSLLMRAKPDEVKLALIDTKIVEFSCYNGIPHLLCPVITDPREASILLRKMVLEAEKRYHMFASTATKQIEGYNEYVKRHNEAHPDEQLEKMPYIVVIIDDLWDLMMVAGKEVEDSILRITQIARSAGIHLIISTQRPSREVLTDIIKSNIPSRLSFIVSSKSDSNIILDQEGAEKLSRMGDMLFKPIGTTIPIHIQGIFVNNNEIEKIIKHTKEQQESTYDISFTKLEEKEKGYDTISYIDMKDDNLYNEVVDFVVKTGKASASLLQRKFRIGYNQAATLIDELEENGIIGPATGNSTPREVLVKYKDDENE